MKSFDEFLALLPPERLEAELDEAGLAAGDDLDVVRILAEKNKVDDAFIQYRQGMILSSHVTLRLLRLFYEWLERSDEP